VGVKAIVIVYRHASTEEMLAECLASLLAIAQEGKRVSACLEWELDKLQRYLDFRRSRLMSNSAVERRVDEGQWDGEWL
jgi:hypothetical protein